MEYIDRVLIPYKLKHNFDKLYFIFDSAKCHTTPKVLNHLENNNIEAIIVPPRFTNLIQPADVIWFSLLKGAYHELWQKWFISNEHSYTKHNNMRSPGYVNCINWCVKLWDEFSSNLLKESFDYTGVCSRNNLHSVLKHIIETDNPINNYLDDEKPADEIDGFDGDDAAFDDEGEVLIDQMDQLIDELDDESIDESYEDSDESVSNESENEESENEDEDEEQNKENEPTTNAASAKRKQRRQESQSKLFAAANENNKPESNSKKQVGQAKKSASNTATTSTATTNTNTTNNTSSKKTTKSTKKASSPLRKNPPRKCQLQKI